MPERAYTVAEIDDLRAACKERRGKERGVPSWQPGDLPWHDIEPRVSEFTRVEEMVRTYMLAGLTADDVRAAPLHDPDRALGWPGGFREAREHLTGRGWLQRPDRLWWHPTMSMLTPRDYDAIQYLTTEPVDP